MNELPDSVKALLKRSGSDRPCCSQCGVSAKPLTIICKGCWLPQYCSRECQSKHQVCHEEPCRALQQSKLSAFVAHPDFLGPNLLSAGQSLSYHLVVGDQVIRMGFHCDRQSNRRSYYREALKDYLRGMVKENAFRDSRIYGTPAEDRVLLLLVVLGGDAQVLLDWLSFTASDEDGDGTEDDTPPSSQSEEKMKHPLLALHGLFRRDSDELSTTVPNLYLLAACRSLAEHRLGKKPFQAYQLAVRQGIHCGFLPPQLESMQWNIASFLWRDDEYEYGEALKEEIPLILHHIQEHKRNGTGFLNYACDGGVNFAPQEAPHLFTNRAASPAVATRLIQPVTQVPELWLMYQECFLAMKPPSIEFLGEGGSKQLPGKAKAD